MRNKIKVEILRDMSFCCGCYACYSICPVDAIQMKQNEEGFIYPCINEKKCIHCNQCKKVCPITQEQKPSKTKVYACYDKQLNRRMESASGGVFALIAEYVIKNHGMVVGAAFTDNFSVEHISVDTIQDLKKLKGSKYVQSAIGEQYKIVKQELEKDRLVLFSGTACQVAGLKSFLKKEFDNLICMDVICHGVPSPKVWKKYLEEISEGKKIKRIKIRNKENGIQNAPFKIWFDDGSVFVQKYEDNLFLKGFIHNLYLRQSCYQCAFKGNRAPSDISIGDFWGLEIVDSQFGDKFGISLVMTHTQKGEQIIEKISTSLEKKAFSEKDALRENPCIEKSVNKPVNRDLFFQSYEKCGVEKTVMKLTKVCLAKRIKIFITKLRYDIKYKIYLCWRKMKK